MTLVSLNLAGMWWWRCAGWCAGWCLPEPHRPQAGCLAAAPAGAEAAADPTRRQHATPWNRHGRLMTEAEERPPFLLSAAACAR
eukprot:COSAG01_NODE_14165_length_1488_cov_1.557955_2_plen_84_part_00